MLIAHQGPDIYIIFIIILTFINMYPDELKELINNIIFMSDRSHDTDSITLQGLPGVPINTVQCSTGFINRVFVLRLYWSPVITETPNATNEMHVTMDTSY